MPGAAHLSLAEFQREGTERALRILERWHGAVLAGGVGLGKTYMAGNIIATWTTARRSRRITRPCVGTRSPQELRCTA